MKKLVLAVVASAVALASVQVSTTFFWDGTTDAEGKVETGSLEAGVYMSAFLART